jgi:hypothetical protein
MPKARRSKLPQQLLSHLLIRMRQWSISADHLVVLACWLDTEPDAPAGKCFKRFPGFVLCGKGEFIKTLLLPGQAPDGEEIE